VQGEDVARVRVAIDRLPPEQRRVVEQRIDEGRTFAEIAAESGLPLGTVLTRMRLAHEALRKALGEDA
jgi:RNA polymerase sigma-70 factor (ECF subfamily)